MESPFLQERHILSMAHSLLLREYRVYINVVGKTGTTLLSRVSYLDTGEIPQCAAKSQHPYSFRQLWY